MVATYILFSWFKQKRKEIKQILLTLLQLSYETGRSRNQSPEADPIGKTKKIYSIDSNPNIFSSYNELPTIGFSGILLLFCPLTLFPNKFLKRYRDCLLGVIFSL
jgi:hypothetical protein